MAARASKKLVSMVELEAAKDKVMMGAERRSMVMSEEEKLKTAFHEAGHTIVGRSLEHHDPVYKVSIIPRGRALGVTVFLPEEDKYSHSSQGILDRICGLYGGRIAEELIYSDEGVTTGAANDIERATELARNMITKWGFSKKLGPLKFDSDSDEPFLGRTAGNTQQTFSEATAKVIDEEIKDIVKNCYSKAKKILEENIDKLNTMAQALMDYETLDRNQIDDIMAGAKPRQSESLEGADNNEDEQDPTIGNPAEQT